MNYSSARSAPQRFLRYWTIPPQFDGMRADLYLCYHLKKISRTKAQKFINEGVFTKQGLPLLPSKRLFANDAVELRVTTPDTLLDAKNVHVDIVFENDDILVLNKPPNLAIHPSGRYYYQTLTYWLKQQYGENYPRPCHRIDRDTSGIVVCAKNKKAQTVVKSAFQKRLVRKSYLAFVRGYLANPIEVNEALALQGSRGLVRIRMIIDPAGMPSTTKFTPIHYCATTHLSVVECEPLTGRQHQIRAHLAHVGLPIIGDKIYQMGDLYFNDMVLGKAVKEPEHFRHALHAFFIEFPFQSEILKFTAPLPDDLLKLAPSEFNVNAFYESQHL